MGESVAFLDYLDEKMELDEVDLRTYSPLALAYIGDDVYDLIVRTVLVKRKNMQVQKLHRSASRMVKASAQAEMAERIMPLLSEEEKQIYKRGRNAHPHTKAKSATIVEYLKATGLEALIGYLYLKKDVKRIIDLMYAGLYEETPAQDSV